MLGIEALLEVLAGAGARYIFGNPGTTELPFSDSLARDDRFRYILGLQEVPVVAMADGYAMASGSVGVACVHICCGLGNAMGMLYNAHREGTPLLLLAGQQDRRLRLGEPVLEGDMVSVARPWTKWAVEVQRVEDVALATRRAVQVALSPPTGPVFVSVPVDVQMERIEGVSIDHASIADRGTRPPVDALRRAAAMLAEARNPCILAGSRVTEAGASDALVRLAEMLGAPVLAEAQTSHGRLPMPSNHPLYRGSLPLWAEDTRQRLSGMDVILVVGMDLLSLYIERTDTSAIPEGARLVHLDQDPWEVGKNWPVEVGLLGDPRAGLVELAQHVSALLDPAQRQAATRRLAEASARREEEQRDLSADIEAAWCQRPMTSLALMGALARALPPETALVEEAATTHQSVLERLGFFHDPAARFAHRGWALGWGVGCALGVRLAWPHRPVLALLGDGAALYGVQGLWTAARYHIPVTFVVANNAQYAILKSAAKLMDLPNIAAGLSRDMDLVDPAVDFCGLARSLGVEAHRVTEPDDLCDRVRGIGQRTEPLLLEVPLQT